MAGKQKPRPPLPDVKDQFARARVLMKTEMPAEEAGASIEPMGLLGRLAVPGAQALTNPLTGNITYNPATNIGRSDAEIADTLLHELTHRKQIMARSIPQRIGSMLADAMLSGLPYHQRPDEMAAFEAEIRRAVGQGRSNYTPSFATGEMTRQADIDLPSSRAAILRALKGGR